MLAPLTLLPMAAAGTVLTAGQRSRWPRVVLRVFLRRLGGPAAAGSVWAVAWLLPVALLLEPVRTTLAYGQINVVLMALVALDGLTEEPRWPRGALVGLAAAVKLTPAAFVLFFLLRRDYRAAAVAGVSFAAATVAGFALAGHDSVRYWTAAVFQTGRIGGPATAANQCVQAVLARAGLDPHTAGGLAAWLALSALVVIVAGRGMRRALAASQECWALSLNAFAVLLISPISWSHHWVWSAPALLTLAYLGRRHHHRLAVAAAACGLVLFTAAPQWWLGRFAGPGTELGALAAGHRELLRFLRRSRPAPGRLRPAPPGETGISPGGLGRGCGCGHHGPFGGRGERGRSVDPDAGRGEAQRGGVVGRHPLRGGADGRDPGTVLGQVGSGLADRRLVGRDAGGGLDRDHAAALVVAVQVHRHLRMGADVPYLPRPRLRVDQEFAVVPQEPDRGRLRLAVRAHRGEPADVLRPQALVQGGRGVRAQV